MNMPDRGRFDVIICGGGIAGCAAALECARMGKSALLLEKSTVLGGLATMGQINFFVPMDNRRGTAICRGMAEEFLRMSIKYGYDSLPEGWENPEIGTDKSPYMTVYPAYIFAMQLTEALDRAQVKILFDCAATQPVMDGKICTGVITDSKSGLEFYGAKMVIDATGDCDILKRAGVPTVDGRNFYTYCGKIVTIDSCRRAAETGNIRDIYVNGASGGRTNLYGTNQPADKPIYHGTDVETVSSYLIQNQLDFLAELKQQDRLSRDVVTLPHMPQFRTTRRIEGDFTLRENDAYRHFDDSVCAINDFDRADYIYEIPLRALTRRGYDNLITCGRSASAEGYAWDIVRVIPPAILTGQCAAAAASRAIEENCAVTDVNMGKLRNLLEAQNVMVRFDDSLMPERGMNNIHQNVEESK